MLLELIQAFAVFYYPCYLGIVLFIILFVIRNYLLNNNDWNVVFVGIKKKTSLIVSNVRIVSYFVVSILFLGASGIWLPWLNISTKFDSFFRADNIFTFVVALLGGILCNKVFHADRIVKDILSELKAKLDSDDTHKSSDIYEPIFKRKEIYREQLALSAFGFLVGSVALIFVVIGYSSGNELNSLSSFLGLIIALVLYLYSTADDVDDSTKFKELSEVSDKSSPYSSNIPNSDELFRDK